MATVKETYGFMPLSVWHLGKSKYWEDLIQTRTTEVKRRRTSKYLPGLKFSSFNAAVAERVIRYWSEEEDLVVDPFAGRTTRAAVTVMLNRNYEGYEIVPKTTENILWQLARLTPDLLNQRLGKYRIYNEDGCQLASSVSESGDLVFTCPPFHQLERYESVPGQLSDIKSYDEFLSQIKQAAKSIFRILKPGKFAVWVVADWRKDGFKLFHKDSIDLFCKAGFLVWDIVINVLNSPFAYCQIGKCAKAKYTSKSHEYILVFKKPEESHK